MTDQVTRYLRNRAAVLRKRAAEGMGNQTEHLAGARQLEIVADEIDAEFHVDDDED